MYAMQFPYTGSSVLLGLYPENNYTPSILLVGGNKESVRACSSCASCMHCVHTLMMRQVLTRWLHRCMR